MSGSSKEKSLVTDPERSTGVVIEVKDKEAREGNEERVISVEEIITLDEGIRGVGEEKV